MERADVHCRFPEETQRYLIAAAVLDGKRRARGDGNLTTNDAVSAEEVAPGVEEMHGATLALGTTGGLAEEFCHHHAGWHAARQGMAVLSVR